MRLKFLDRRFLENTGQVPTMVSSAEMIRNIILLDPPGGTFDEPAKAFRAARALGIAYHQFRYFYQKYALTDEA